MGRKVTSKRPVLTSSYHRGRQTNKLYQNGKGSCRLVARAEIIVFDQEICKFVAIAVVKSSLFLTPWRQRIDSFKYGQLNFAFVGTFGAEF